MQVAKAIVRVHDDGNFVENRKKLDEAIIGPTTTLKATPLKGGRVEVEGLTPDEMETWIYLRGIPASVVGI